MAMRAVALFLVVLAVGCGAEEAVLEPVTTSGKTTYSGERRGYEVTFPSSWHRATEALTPGLAEPWEILSVGTAAPVVNDDESACGHLPVSAIDTMGPEDVFLTVQERTNTTSPEMTPGPP